MGEGIKNAINAGVCRREDLFVVSKLWNTYHAEEHVYGALHRSLSDLQLEYVDLYLIHFPISLKYVPFEKRYPPGWTFDPDSVDAKQRKIILEKSPVHKTWRAMEGLVEKGLVQHIGVCNFNVSLLMDLVAHANIMPAMLQVEMHPRLQQTKLLEFCRHLEIAVTAFSPFGSIGYVEVSFLKVFFGSVVAIAENATHAAVFVHISFPVGSLSCADLFILIMCFVTDQNAACVLLT